MRYLVLTPDFPPEPGGVQTLLAGIAAGLAARNDVTVVAPASAGADEFDAGLIYRVRRYAPSDSRVGRMANMARAATPLAADCDVLFCGHVAAAPAAYLLGTIYRKPYLVYVHALEITPERYRRLFTFLLRRAAGILTGSRYGRSLVVSRFGLPREAVDVIRPGVAPELVEASGNGGSSPGLKNAGERVILSVARLRGDERYKGHDVVIRAMPLIVRCVPRCYYWIVGAGDDEARLRDLAEESGVADNVVFWGRVEDVAPYYRACDVFVMPNRRVVEDGVEKNEGFGLVFLEASLFAKPVVAGRCGGALDAVDDGHTGLLVDPECPAEVAAAVVALLTYPGEARRLGDAGRERVLREFTVPSQVASFEAAVVGRISDTR
ncbi:MAG: glycosyltransferase family 4 protein [Candidatus Zixiibacteriota bacterium]